MIGKLNGIVDSIYESSLILDVSGVGYRVFCATAVLANIQGGQNLSLFIHTDVKEESIMLYGFSSLEDKEAFTLLRSVNGVGCKVAIAILSNIHVSGIQEALYREDASVFKAISGIGPKLAGRIVLELKNKHFASEMASTQSLENKLENNIINDAVSALVNLGISKIEGENIVRQLISETPDITLSDLIRLALSSRSNV